MQAILACEKQEQRDPYRQILINCGVDCGADDAVTYAQLSARINRGGAELLVAVLGKNPVEALRLVDQIHQKSPLPILMMGPGDDAQLILQAMKAGARDYVDVAQPRESLTKSLEKLRKTGAIRFQRGQSIVVTGAIPGSGVTTVASGLAFALGAKYPKQVVLAELGVPVPELALDLDLQPRYSVSQMLQDWNRADASTVRQAALEHARGVYILADAVSGRGVAAAEEADACRQMLLLLRTLYNHAVYDIGHAAQTELAQQAIRLADRVVMVVRLDVPGVRMARAMLNRLTDIGVQPAQLTLVANRYGQRKQIGWRKAEEALGATVAVWLPEDPGTVNQALNYGIPLTEASGWSKFGRRLHELAKLMVPAPAKK
ncbi:MAG TPA: hypothetical protein VFE62_25705 [Gemmataceae bacterium]|nr:hypothetical protein [Gemmataceae bacterium]